ncbi:lethal(3)malignant brain tumor-like protein 4 isoform X3 [Suricata suricatta]|uniref:lethal(3)malignant brain tumor-like protein 4 isoform X3 n=1 Tax=Suricata suricatta TaxID=37032 RepID=UPI001156AFFC|nr:lethal(3)malignant brain tumor-like protein 4 isoform X3 [Suricata suricatta]
MKQPNRKRKLSMDSKEHLNQDGCLEQAGEEKKPREAATPSSHGSSVAAQEAWSWEQYLTEQKAVAAPVELFSKDQSFPEHENGFQVGMRLEGIDPRHPSVFCVLSVAEVCGYRLRLHFDGYLSCYDFWTNAGSPDIHPVGWCEKTKHELHIPKGYRKDKFVWMDYLKACKLQNAPKKLFRNRSSHGPMPKEFQVGMKLEAIDRKNPSLVCVATIADIVEDRLLVHFDNWDDSYDYWCDVNSPYVQPVGWCQENGRTLIAPQGYPDPENFSWTKYLEATQTNAVPAKVFKMRPPHGFLPSMRLEAVDRRNPRLIRVATVIDVDEQRLKVHFDGWDHKYDYWMDADSPDIHPIGWCDITGHPLEVPYQYSAEQTQQALQQSVFMSSMSAHPFRDLPLGREQHCKLLPGVANIQAGEVARWSVDEVAEFVQSLLGCEDHAKCFKKEQIDGKAFLLLTQTDIVKVMKIKLGPALKIYNSILMFRNSQDLTEDSLSGQETRG